jgi:hypothetical protein
MPSVTSVLRGFGCLGAPTGRSVLREDGPVDGETLRIRSSRAALLPVLLLAFCTIPLATASLWLAVLFVIPLGALLWVLRAGVDVDAGGVTVRGLAGRRRVGWDEVNAVRVARRGDLRLVLRGGGELRLPCARVAQLPAIAAVSGGRLPALGQERAAQ